jgi:hypothetical protein
MYKYLTPKGEVRVYNSMVEFKNRKKNEDSKLICGSWRKSKEVGTL